MLRDEITPYIQGDGLVSNVVNQGSFRNCDNGVLFTSEYYLLLALTSQLQNGDVEKYQSLIASCCATGDGYLHRAPNDTSLDEQDDHNGAYATHAVLGITPAFRLSRNLWRFPSLIAMAAITSRGVLYRLVAFPLEVVTAIIIATSCIGADINDTDARIGAWLVIQATKSSLLCRLAAIIWKRRLMRTYLNGMKDVFAAYFTAEHPLAKYMVIS